MLSKSERVQRDRDKKTAWLRELKASTSCADCGGRFLGHVMQFDHVRGEKSFMLSSVTKTNISWCRIKEEVDKCDIVCANCHAMRTYNRRIRMGDREVDCAPLLRELG